MRQEHYKARFEGGIWDGREMLIAEPTPLRLAREAAEANPATATVTEQAYQLAHLEPSPSGLTIVRYRPVGPPVSKNAP